MRRHRFSPHRRTLVAAGVLAIIAGSPGCGDGVPSGPAGRLRGDITVSAAASLAAPFTTMGDQFEAANAGVIVRFDFGASDQLALQIRDGAPADVAAFADVASMDRLARAGLLAATPTPFATNRLAVVTKPDLASRVRDLRDLPSAGTIALCAPSAPCGRLAAQLLRSAGVTVPESSVTRAPDARATLAAVAEGDACAGIVYETDARAARHAVVEVEAPEVAGIVARYPIAVLATTSRRDVADAFVAWVTGRQGRAVLDAAGFGSP